MQPREKYIYELRLKSLGFMARLSFIQSKLKILSFFLNLLYAFSFSKQQQIFTLAYQNIFLFFVRILNSYDSAAATNFLCISWVLNNTAQCSRSLVDSGNSHTRKLGSGSCALFFCSVLWSYVAIYLSSSFCCPVA